MENSNICSGRTFLCPLPYPSQTAGIRILGQSTLCWLFSNSANIGFLRVFAERAAHSSSPDGHSPYQKIQIMLYEILEQLQPLQTPSPKLTCQVTLSWSHTWLTGHPDVCLEGKHRANKDFYSLDTQQLSTVGFVVALQVNCPFPCFLYLDDKSSGSRSTAAPPPTPQGTLSF